MPLIMTASPASVETTKQGEVWGYKLCDPEAITRQGTASSLADAQAEFADFVADLAKGRWIAHANWSGPDAAPRGFRAAETRRAFYRKVDTLDQAA